MTKTLPGWPQRPDGFYTDWETFCTAALTARMESGDSTSVPSVLLAAGASLGAGVLVTLAQSNRKTLAELGEQWGIKALPDLVAGGGAVLGAALGGFGGALLSRVLGAHADQATVKTLQATIAAVRREFTELRDAWKGGSMDEHRHRAAVEVLFQRLAKD